MQAKSITNQKIKRWSLTFTSPLHHLTCINIQHHLKRKINPLPTPKNFQIVKSPLHQIAHINIQRHLTNKLNPLPTERNFKIWSPTSTSPLHQIICINIQHHLTSEHKKTVSTIFFAAFLTVVPMVLTSLQKSWLAILSLINNR
jgi:hypothetical protein